MQGLVSKTGLEHENANTRPRVLIFGANVPIARIVVEQYLRNIAYFQLVALEKDDEQQADLARFIFQAIGDQIALALLPIVKVCSQAGFQGLGELLKHSRIIGKPIAGTCLFVNSMDESRVALSGLEKFNSLRFKPVRLITPDFITKQIASGIPRLQHLTYNSNNITEAAFRIAKSI